MLHQDARSLKLLQPRSVVESNIYIYIKNGVVFKYSMLSQHDNELEIKRDVTKYD